MEYASWEKMRRSGDNFSRQVLCFFSALFLLHFVPSLGLTIDGTLLLSFKYSILDDPLSVLENWNYEDATPCLWKGVTCEQIGSPPDVFRVVSLVLPNSGLLGSIPEDLGYIHHLKTLDLSGNFLNGTLPYSLFNASELQVLSLSSNSFTGGLPGLMPGIKSLKFLNLSENSLAGNVPAMLSSLQELNVISLRKNFFTGVIPSGFQYVEVLDLSSNLFNGSLPVEFSGERLRYLNLSSNKLSGMLPSDFAEKILGNATIDLSFNNFTGEIPKSMALSNQKTESFKGNLELCGKPLNKACTVPSSFSLPPPNVTTANSSAPAIAAIPQTIDSNPNPNAPGATTAGSSQGQQHVLKPGMIAGMAVGGLAGFGVIAMVCFYVYQVKNRRADESSKNIPQIQKNYHQDFHFSVAAMQTTSSTATTRNLNLPSWPCLTLGNGEETSETTVSDCDEMKNVDYIEDQIHQVDHQNVNNDVKNKYMDEKMLVIVDGETELELETLLRASAYILGSSTGASIVYKAVLQNGNAFAVRRIGESGVERFKVFEHQVKAIAKLRHPNLVVLRGFYWGEDEKLVIYDYISNGSLANADYRKVGSSPYHMPFQVRLKIAKGVARGLSYIHEKKHVHGNIKPSNILLTQEMEPVISDFGLHWLMYGKHNNTQTDPHASSRHFGSRRANHPAMTSGSPWIAPALGFMGCTSPYHAPESLKNLKPNPKWDVYSFGILLLELLTGRVFSDRELGEWTSSTGLEMEDKDRVLGMADAAIRVEVANREDIVLECFKLGFNCASLNPQKRPSMKDALQILERFPSS